MASSSSSSSSSSFRQLLWQQFKKRRLGYLASMVVLLFCLAGIYAPLLASSKPLIVNYKGEWYFPLFRYLFYTGFYTKRLDLFFNLLMFTLPLSLVVTRILKNSIRLKKISLLLVCILQVSLFSYFTFLPPKDPTNNPHIDSHLIKNDRAALKETTLPNWDLELTHLSTYAQLNLVLKEQQAVKQHQKLLSYQSAYLEAAEKKGLVAIFPTLWQMEQQNEQRQVETEQAILKKEPIDSVEYLKAQATRHYIQQRRAWILAQLLLLQWEIMPLLSSFHWEEDAGGSMRLNQVIKWWDLSRINRKDLLAGLIFGIRISLVVGLVSVAIAMLIGIPIGAFAGYYGGTLDIIVSRLLEVWEAMPTFFMLLLVIALLQSKSIFLVIAVIGIFGWTTFSRYIRGEFFKQRHLLYVEACQSMGFSNRFIMFSHILPNAIPPLLTLIPFAVMGAITSEAGLSFLGLGEENSCSWGVLMDEGRLAFPAESYLLWPPAILLTILLIAIALMGDALRDALDPKMHRL